MVATTREWHTPERVRLLPDDGNRYECVAGELLVTPAPSLRHQAALAELYDALRVAVAEAGLRMIWSPADLELRRDALVQPDLFVFQAKGRTRPEWSDIRQLELAIEVLSPSTARYDRVVKRRLFQEVGVPEYWIVDLDARVVERWRPDDERPEVCADTLSWLPAGAPAAIAIDLPELFSRALDG